MFVKKSMKEKNLEVTGFVCTCTYMFEATTETQRLYIDPDIGDACNLLIITC